jgi:hypothetical protein
MNKYTPEEILKAAELGEVSMIDAKHIVSLLPEARLRLQGMYVLKPDNVKGVKVEITSKHCLLCSHLKDNPPFNICQTCVDKSNYISEK